MSSNGFAVSVLALALSLSSCTNGALNGTLAADLTNTGTAAGASFNGTIFGGIYSHTVQPITFNREPIEFLDNLEQAQGQINHVQAGTLMASIRLGKNGIGDVAKKSGISTVYYADIERRIILFGLWQESILHIYGR